MSISVCVYYTSVITQEGTFVLMWAAIEGKTEVVEELVKAGANVDMQNEVRSYVNILVVHNVHTNYHTLQWYTFAHILLFTKHFQSLLSGIFSCVHHYSR